MQPSNRIRALNRAYIRTTIHPWVKISWAYSIAKTMAYSPLQEKIWSYRSTVSRNSCIKGSPCLLTFATMTKISQLVRIQTSTQRREPARIRKRNHIEIQEATLAAVVSIRAFLKSPIRWKICTFSESKIRKLASIMTSRSLSSSKDKLTELTIQEGHRSQWTHLGSMLAPQTSAATKTRNSLQTISLSQKLRRMASRSFATLTLSTSSATQPSTTPNKSLTCSRSMLPCLIIRRWAKSRSRSMRRLRT